jgi:hypothetical protein
VARIAIDLKDFEAGSVERWYALTSPDSLIAALGNAVAFANTLQPTAKPAASPTPAKKAGT